MEQTLTVVVRGSHLEAQELKDAVLEAVKDALDGTEEDEDSPCEVEVK